MNLDIFKTPKQLPFLYCSVKDVEYTDTGETKTIKNQMSIQLGDKPIIEQPSLDDLWTLVDLERVRDHKMGRFIGANILMNEIARRTRRACGNILIVPNDTEKVIFDKEFPGSQYEHRSSIRIVVDTTLESNELRATYWKIHYKRERIGDRIITTDIPVAVDGGIQISPDGFSCIQRDNDTIGNYTDYFVRGFM